MQIDAEQIFKECNYNPEKIGIAILEMTGKYVVKEWLYSDSSLPSVYRKVDNNKEGYFLHFENEKGEHVHSSKDGKPVYGKFVG